MHNIFGIDHSKIYIYQADSRLIQAHFSSKPIFVTLMFGAHIEHIRLKK
jgi:hypothetical protein